jgi:leader peptidase (prepilin peptidase) / N-methyltransferase
MAGRMGSLGAVAFCVGSVLGGGAVGSWASSSPLVVRCIDAAGASRPAGTPRPVTGVRLPRQLWALAGGIAAGAVAVALVARAAPPVALSPLVGWACALSVLGLIDTQELALPTPILRAATLATGASLVATSAAAGAWDGLLSAAGAAAAAAAAYGTWALVRPRALGFGDVRMACLVALGVGACSPSWSLVALSCAPLAAGLGCRYAGRRPRVVAAAVPATTAGQADGGSMSARAVPLGPFLAIAGVVGVVAGAI